MYYLCTVTLYLFLCLSVCDDSVLSLSVLQQLLEGHQVGLQELQFGGEQLSSFLLGSYSSQFILQLVSCLVERRQAGNPLLDLQEHLLYINTHKRVRSRKWLLFSLYDVEVELFSVCEWI